MKKFIVSLLTLVLASSFICSSAAAVTFDSTNLTLTNHTIEYISDDLYVESFILEETSDVSLLTTTKTKTASKYYYIRNNDSENLALFKLTGTYTYNGSSSSCTAASYSTTIYDDSWKFTSVGATKSGSTATGTFTAKKTLLFITVQTINKSITLTCDKDGNLS